VGSPRALSCLFDFRINNCRNNGWKTSEFEPRFRYKMIISTFYLTRENDNLKTCSITGDQCIESNWAARTQVRMLRHKTRFSSAFSNSYILNAFAEGKKDPVPSGESVAASLKPRPLYHVTTLSKSEPDSIGRSFPLASASTLTC